MNVQLLSSSGRSCTSNTTTFILLARPLTVKRPKPLHPPVTIAISFLVLGSKSHATPGLLKRQWFCAHTVRMSLNLAVRPSANSHLSVFTTYPTRTRLRSCRSDAKGLMRKSCSGWRIFSGPLVRMRRSGPVKVGSSAARLMRPIREAIVEETFAAAIFSRGRFGLRAESSEMRRNCCHYRGGRHALGVPAPAHARQGECHQPERWRRESGRFGILKLHSFLGSSTGRAFPAFLVLFEGCEDSGEADSVGRCNS